MRKRCNALAHTLSVASPRSQAMKYDCDTDDGQSGSPVYHFNGGNRQVVGVHKGYFGNGWNGANRIRNGNFDALCEAIHENQTNHVHDCY